MAAVQELDEPQVDEQDQQDGDPVETYYNYLKKSGADVAPTLDSFKRTLSDENTARQYYTYLKQNKFDAPPTYDSFSRTLGASNSAEIPKLDYRTPVRQQMANSNAQTPNVPAKAPTESTVDQLAKKHALAQTVIQKELGQNQDVAAGIIKDQKFRNQSSDDLTQLMQQPRSDQPQTNPQVDANLATPAQQPAAATNQEVTGFLQNAQSDPNAGRGFLSHVIAQKPDKANVLKSALYVNDAIQRAQDEGKATKVLQNAQGIEKGQLDYSPTSGLLTKPEDVWQSIASGAKQKTQAFKDYNLFSNATPQQAIDELEKRRKDYDPDEPVAAPSGFLASTAQGLASQPIRGMLAGKVVGGATALIPGAEPLAPAVDKFVAAAQSGDDFRKMTYANSLQQNYNQLRSEGMAPEDAYQKANGQAKTESLVDAVGGAGMMLGAGAVGDIKLPKFSLSAGYTAALGTALKQVAKGVGEAGAIGLIQGEGQQIKDQAAGSNGINRSGSGEDLGEAAKSGFLFTLGLAAMAKGFSAMSDVAKSKLLQGLSKAPTAQVNEGLGNLVSEGHITPQEAQQVSTAIETHRLTDASIPDNVTDESRLKIQDKIKRRDYLESQLESADKAFHPDIKEKIKAVNDDILELAQDKKPRGEQDILSQKPTEDGQKTTDAQTEGQVNPEGAAPDTGESSAPSYLISRHADTLKDEEGKTSGPNQHPLSPDGQKDAAALADEVQQRGEETGMPVTKIVHSDLERASQTADKVAEKTGAQTVSDPQLNTWDIGQFNDFKDDEFKQVQKWFVEHPDEKTYQGDLEKAQGKSLGETFNDYAKRTIDAHAKYENEPASTLMIDHSNNMMVMDAYRKNGNEWNDQAAQDYLNAEKPEPATLVDSQIGNSVLRGMFHIGDMIQSSHFEGERKIVHVGRDHVVVEDPGGEHIKHEIPIVDIKTKDYAGSIPENQGGTTEEGSSPEGRQDIGSENLQQHPSEAPEHGETVEPAGEGKVIGTKNKITEAIRSENGLPPVEIPEDRTQDESLNGWRDGTRTPQEIVDQLLAPGDIYNKSITPNDEPIMREYIRGLENRGVELNKLVESLSDKVKDGDEKAIADQASLRQQLLNHYDEMGRALDAEAIGGNIWHKYGMERQLAVNEKGQVVNSIGRIKAIYGDEMPAEIKKQLSDLQQKYDALEAKTAKIEEASKKLQAENELLKQNQSAKRAKGVNKTDSDFAKERKDILADMKQSLKDAGKQMYATLPGVPQLAAIAPHVLKLFKSFGEQGVIKFDEAVGKIHDLVKDVLEGVSKEDIKDIIQGKYTDTDKLKREGESLQKRVDKGPVFKMPSIKRLWEKDPEWVKNNQAKADLKSKLRNMEKAAFDSKKNMYMKGWDWFNRWGRRIIFFGANAVYTKLSSAAVVGAFAHRLPETFAGKLNAKMFPHIAKNAPIEGNLNAASEAKFYQEFLNPVKFAKNIWSQAKSGETPLSKELGGHSNEKHIPIVDLFAADAHAMIKDPVKRATFEAAVMAHLKFYADNQIDGTHPLMLESARQAAYKTALYEIFQNSPKITKGINKFFGDLEKSGVVNVNMPDGWSKVKGNAQYTAASLYHFFVPVNSVPANILERIGLGLSTPATMIKAMSKNKDIRNGILNMSQEESDLLMRQLKKGQIGTAYWTLGFILGGSALGGLYTKYDPDKERGNNRKINEMNVLDTDIPKDWQHNYQFQSAQMGATWNTVYNHFINDKGASQMEALAKATAATTGAALESIPALGAGVKAVEATQSNQAGEKWVKDLKQRMGIGKATTIMQMMGYGEDNSGGSGGGAGAGSSYKIKEWQQ